MLIKKFISLAVLLLFAAGPSLAADTYTLDMAHSSVGFSIKHLVISKVRGNFGDVSTTIMYDEKDISKSSVEVSIKAASINTDNEDRDNHLRSADFFDVEKYPEITFKSKKVMKTDKGHVAVGDFTMHGVTKEISLPFVVTGIVVDPWGNTKMGVESEITIDRRDYGLTWSKAIETGGLVVGNDVEIEIFLELSKSK